MKGKYRADLILLLAVLLIGAVLALRALSSPTGACVHVRVDGTVVAAYSLSDARSEVIAGVNDGSNLLIIENGAAYVSQASCPDGLCIHTGRISKAGQSIVCLPNRVVIEIVSDGAGEVDAVTG